MKKLPDDAIVRLIDLPPGIGGAVMEDEDGFLSIYVNARHGHYAQLDDLDHEIIHIENDDLHNSDDIFTIEARADARAAKLKSIPRLMKARDLLPPRPKPSPAPIEHDNPVKRRTVPLSPRQAAAILRALSDLDRFLFTSEYDF